jgi:polysaccharide export outer membrane protein
MKTNLSSNLIRLVSRGTAAYCGLVLAALFGFSGCATPGQDPKDAAAAVAAAHSEAIILREGDSVRVSFPGSPNLDTTQPIRRDGKIALQLVGEVQAAGLTPEELQDSLIKLYAPQIATKEITVSVLSSEFPVYVTGAVVRPGKIMSDHPMTALEAVMEAGGFDYTTANMRSVRIIRNENGVMKHYTINLKRVLAGNGTDSFYLKPGDIIYVSQRLELF